MYLTEAPTRTARDYPARTSEAAGLPPLSLPRVTGDDLRAREEELRLVRLAQKGDRRALDTLVQQHMGLVYRSARAYRCRSHSIEDLVQEGTLGLISAIQRFDAARGCRLTTYAVHWIRQAIARAADQTDRIIHVPEQAVVELRKLQRAREERSRALGRTPTEAELAEETGISHGRVEQLLRAVDEPVSLDTLVGPDQESSLTELLEDPNAVCPERDAVSGLYHEQVRHLLGTLHPRERTVLEQRYGFNGHEPGTLDDVGRRLRLSRERVRQLEATAIRKLRYAIRAARWE